MIITKLNINLCSVVKDTKKETKSCDLKQNFTVLEIEIDLSMCGDIKTIERVKNELEALENKKPSNIDDQSKIKVKYDPIISCKAGNLVASLILTYFSPKKGEENLQTRNLNNFKFREIEYHYQLIIKDFWRALNL